LGLAVPIHRSNPLDPSTSSWEISEALLMQEALTFYTRNAAYQMFRENERGTLEVGKKADFLVLGSNPFLIDPHDVSKITINAVYQNGRVHL
jgi:predicted amidohydrolase YtcJ